MKRRTRCDIEQTESLRCVCQTSARAVTAKRLSGAGRLSETIFLTADTAEPETTVAAVAQHVHRGIAMGFGSGAVLFRGIPHQQPAESGVFRGDVRAHTEERRRHRNRAARSAAGHTQTIVVRHGQHSVDAEGVRRFREISVDRRRKVSETIPSSTAWSSPSARTLSVSTRLLAMKTYDFTRFSERVSRDNKYPSDAIVSQRTSNCSRRIPVTSTFVVNASKSDAAIGV